MTHPNDTGAPRAAAANVSISVLQCITPFGNIDATHAVYGGSGGAVLPCSDLAHETHPPI